MALPVALDKEIDVHKLLVMEINEVPLDVLLAYRRVRPNAYLSILLDQQQMTRTVAEDLPESELYPSQAWASLNTGKPYAQHGVKWFNDPKNYADFYWAQAAEAGLSTVLVATPHSSPMFQYIDKGNYKAVIPDFFAEDEQTLPTRYQAFQNLNLSLTMSNRRSTGLKSTLLQVVSDVLRYPRPSSWGASWQVMRDLLPVLPQAMANPERLRQGQFPLYMQIFQDQLKLHVPDLGIVASNHVASAMHRYFHAMPGHDPSHNQTSVYQREWLKKHENEVFSALDLVDRWLRRLQPFIEQHHYALALVSAIGQRANPSLNQAFIDDYCYDYRLKVPKKLFNALGIESISSLRQIGAMLPQYAFRLPTLDEACALQQRLQRFKADPSVIRYGHYTPLAQSAEATIELRGVLFHVDRQHEVVTLTIMLQPDAMGNISIGQVEYHFSDLGFEQFSVQDHHSGEHSKQGVLLYNQAFVKALPQPLESQVNYLEVAGLFKQVLALD